MNRPFIKAGIVGLLVIVMSIVLLAVFPSKAVRLPDGFFTPIIAFEFIETKAPDAEKILITPDCPLFSFINHCQPHLLALSKLLFSISRHCKMPEEADDAFGAYLAFLCPFQKILRKLLLNW